MKDITLITILFSIITTYLFVLLKRQNNYKNRCKKNKIKLMNRINTLKRKQMEIK